MVLGEGSKGPIYSEIKCLRIYRAFAKETGEVPIKSCWLFIRRLENGETRFSVSNAPEDTPDSELCKASLMRWPIEQCFHEAKSELGMDHYEFRSWTAWHRHMLLVFIASAFLFEIRLLVKDKKSPILTLPMALLLVVAALSGDDKIIKKALKKLDYYLRRNYCAYKSHSLKRFKKCLTG